MMKEKTADDFIAWLYKELIDMIYHRKATSKEMAIYNKLISKWRQENENLNSSN